MAWLWRERDGYTGPWVFYSSHARKRALGDDPREAVGEAGLELVGAGDVLPER
jgi:hypothetical protein